MNRYVPTAQRPYTKVMMDAKPYAWIPRTLAFGLQSVFGAQISEIAISIHSTAHLTPTQRRSGYAAWWEEAIKAGPGAIFLDSERPSEFAPDEGPYARFLYCHLVPRGLDNRPYTVVDFSRAMQAGVAMEAREFPAPER